MGTIIKLIISNYYYFNEEVADPRTNNWLFVGSPWPIAAIIVGYLYFVQVIGPRWMANKKPFNLNKIMQIYNVVQIVLSAYILYQCLALGWLGHYSFRCEPVDYSWNPRPLKIARAVWVYFIIKIVDLLDTVFFVLRKKQHQVTFLHVYHHAGMVFCTWNGVKYFAGGHATFIGLLNSFVHVIMYTHYLITSLKIANPWWKKYITQLQLAQFILILHHFAQLLWTPYCGFPRWPLALFIPQNLFMLVLFGDFYYKTYVKKPQKKSSATNATTSTTEQHGITTENTNAKSKSQ